MPTPLPVRIEPQDDESVPSMLQRLSTVTGIPLECLHRGPMTHLLTGPQTTVRSGRPARHTLDDEWEQAATTLQIPRTELIWKHALGGSRFSTPTRDVAPFQLRDPSGLVCGRCERTEIWAHLTLVTACQQCGLLLGTDSDAGIGFTIGRPPSDAAVEMQRDYLDGLRRTDWVDRDRMKRLWHLFELILCGIGSPLDLDVRGGPRVPLPAGRPMRVQAAFTPSWVSEVAAHIWPASATDTETQGFVLQRLDRALQNTSNAARSEPNRHQDLDTQRLKLHDRLRRLGMTPDRVPDLVMSSHRFGRARCHLEAIAHSTSLALREETAMAQAGASDPLLTRELTVPSEMWPSWNVRSLVAHLRDTSSGLALLEREAHALCAGTDRASQQDRHAGLRRLRSVPSDVLLQAGLPANPSTARVAAAWIWLEVALGTWSAAPHNRALRGQVQRFNDHLTPEGVLVLLEYADAVTGAVQSDIERELVQHTLPQSTAEAG